MAEEASKDFGETLDDFESGIAAIFEQFDYEAKLRPNAAMHLGFMRDALDAEIEVIWASTDGRGLALVVMSDPAELGAYPYTVELA